MLRQSLVVAALAAIHAAVTVAIPATFSSLDDIRTSFSENDCKFSVSRVEVSWHIVSRFCISTATAICRTSKALVHRGEVYIELFFEKVD